MVGMQIPFQGKLIKAKEIPELIFNEEIEVFDYVYKLYHFTISTPGKLCCNNEAEIYQVENEIYVGKVTPGEYLRLGIGEYYARIERSLGKYNFTYEPESPNTTEQENNNSFDSANCIETDISYVGNLNYTGMVETPDVDYYKFVISEQKSAYVEFRVDGSSYDPNYLLLYSEDEYENTELLTSIYCFSGSSKKTEKYRLPAGTYYVCITNYGNFSEYSFKVCTADSPEGTYEQEYNDTIDSATSFECNKDYIGNISTNLDIDYFKTYVSTTGKARLKVRTPRQTDNKMFLVTLYEMDEGGNLLKKDSIYSTTNPVVFGKNIYIEPGIYYIKVENGNGDTDSHIDYQVQLQFTECTLITDLQLSVDKTQLVVGDIANINILSKPNQSVATDLTWTSSDKSIVTVNKYGQIICKNKGKAYIKAVATDGSNVSAEILVTVSEKQSTTGSVELVVKDAKSDNATLKKIDVSKGKVKASSTETYVVTLDKNTSSTKITPITTHKKASYTINKKKVKSIQVSLGRGKSKTVTIRVKAENEDTRIYKVIIKRK